jgi:3-isopropylmalate/(R)-2-methylmalate dehydratase small subunit
MQKFTTLDAVAAVLLEPNINTDIILPAVWVLNAQTDLGQKLFANRRYGADGAESTDFVLNREPFRSSRILLAGANFGCGSSREAAVWALCRFGIRCVIAPSFGDIFYENCFQNGLLPIRLGAERVQSLAFEVASCDSHRLTIDLQELSICVPGKQRESFALSEDRRKALLEGRDAMTQTLEWLPDVAAHERADAARRPWIYFPRIQK